MKYGLYERFRTFQGEGVHMGRSAYFLRLYGCDQHCPWCDSAGTWHKDFRPSGMPYLTAYEIAQLVEAEVKPPTFVVVTGGEPTMYDLTPLSDCLHAYGFKVHLETAGHHEIKGKIDWITLSPKPFAAHPVESSIKRANEFKIIVESEESLAASLACIEGRRETAPVWLHPEWGKRHDPEVLALISRTVTDNPAMRAGWQMHKLFNVDALDPNSEKRRIPLGGDPQRGSAI